MRGRRKIRNTKRHRKAFKNSARKTHIHNHIHLKMKRGGFRT